MPHLDSQLRDAADLDHRLRVPVVAVPRLAADANHVRTVRPTVRGDAPICTAHAHARHYEDGELEVAVVGLTGEDADAAPLLLHGVERQDEVVVVLQTRKRQRAQSHA